MTDAIVTVRVDKQVHEQMRRHDEVNWSAVLRKSIQEHLIGDVDTKKAKAALDDIRRMRHAAKEMDEMRHAGTFDSGKSGVEIIREWRDRRK